MGFVDNRNVEVRCPKCGRTVKQTIGDARRSRSIRCPGGHTINVDGSQLDRGTRQVEKAHDDLMRRLKRGGGV
jgi:DNA-directed RNA polymerase subunit RPC12/RpoP